MSIITKKNVLLVITLILLYIVIQISNYFGILSDYVLFILMIGMINAILAVSLNLITGFTGQFSIGHAAFMAIGAYVSAIFSKNIFQITPDSSLVIREFGFLFSLLAGAIVAGSFAFLIGIPTLRLKGDYLCIATLGFNQIVVAIFNNVDQLGGPRGFTDIPQLSTFTWIFILTILSIVVMRNFINSIYGKQCIAIREDEIAAESLRVNTTKYKAIAFIIASFFAGLAGGLLSHLIQLAHPSSFTFLKSIEILLWTVVGGLGSITGSMISAISLTILPEVLRFSESFRLVLYPLLLIFFVLKNPIPILKQSYELIKKKIYSFHTTPESGRS